MLRFVFTISTIFPSLDEFQEEVPRHWFSLRFGKSYSDVYPQTWIQTEFCRVKEGQHKTLSVAQ